MNREIKLKVWDKEKKRMSFPITFGSFMVKWDDGDIDMPMPFAEAKNDRFIFIPFTGYTHFITGDIYDGDIVRVRGTRRVGEYTTSIIASSQGFTLLDNKTYLNNDKCFIAIEEVIGNMYEQ